MQRVRCMKFKECLRQTVGKEVLPDIKDQWGLPWSQELERSMTDTERLCNNAQKFLHYSHHLSSHCNQHKILDPGLIYFTTQPQFIMFLRLLLLWKKHCDGMKEIVTEARKKGTDMGKTMGPLSYPQLPQKNKCDLRIIFIYYRNRLFSECWALFWYKHCESPSH